MARDNILTYFTGKYRTPAAPRTCHTLRHSGVPGILVYEAREVETFTQVAYGCVTTDDFGNLHEIKGTPHQLTYGRQDI